jgi:hypothetical protein
MDALSGDNNFTDAGQLVRCHDNEVTLWHYQCSSAMSYFTDVMAIFTLKTTQVHNRINYIPYGWVYPKIKFRNEICVAHTKLFRDGYS